MASNAICWPCSSGSPPRRSSRCATRRLRRFLALPSADRRLRLSAAFLLPLVRLALLALPHQLITRTLRNSGTPGTTPTHNAQRIGWAVGVAARRMPFAFSCLTQALTACILLRRDGHRAALRLGAARDARGRFTAHAWVENEGTVLVGAPHHREFVAFPAWEPRA